MAGVWVYDRRMADVILFSSAADNTKRLAVIADDSTLVLRLEVRDAANALQIVHTLSSEDRARIVSFWNATKVDRSMQLKATSFQLWFSINTDNTSVWAANTDDNTVALASTEITLTAIQTAAVAAWCQHGFVAA